MGRFEGGGDSSDRFDSWDRFDRVRRIRWDNATEIWQDDDSQREGGRREHNQKENSEIVQRSRLREEMNRQEEPGNGLNSHQDEPRLIEWRRQRIQKPQPEEYRVPDSHQDEPRPIEWRRQRVQRPQPEGYRVPDSHQDYLYRIERESTLEDLRPQLDHLLIWYFREMRNQGFSWENKELFLNVFDRLSRREKHIYINSIVEYLQGKCKKADAFKELLDDMRGIDKLEVYAWLSNACRRDNSWDDYDEYRWERRHRREQREYEEEPLSFEISWGTITKNVITLWRRIKNEEKTFSITGGDVESLWDNMFRIDLEWKRRIWSYWVWGTQETLVLRFSGRNTIEVFDPQWERRLWIVQMRNTGEDFRRWGREKNISFEIGGTEISLDLIIDRR